MNIRVNGQTLHFSKEKMTIIDLLSSYQLQEKIAVVERNKEIISKEAYRRTELKDGDMIEIVHFVGGG
ncbi:sulfur carrier protein ThiS [Virgibacillus proomii]|uniref:sulfur carrier protein ThiS n=1 Tax=Virgibacillus proomii TaxID=84407 RepID=UPI001C1131EC|nr:sulfur carrier protein ThiS [Virgibacillus proomii]MBU5266881.1 sulfur carrier protein ThiS [Virgibacillus proomii]